MARSTLARTVAAVKNPNELSLHASGPYDSSRVDAYTSSENRRCRLPHASHNVKFANERTTWPFQRSDQQLDALPRLPNHVKTDRP
jgi:hypothetical protein